MNKCLRYLRLVDMLKMMLAVFVEHRQQIEHLQFPLVSDTYLVDTRELVRQLVRF